MTCKICGGELASSRHSTRDIHQSLGTCIKSLQARATAAEAELEQLAWRPVSERPPNDAPVLALLESGEYKVARYVVIGDINGVPLHHWRGTGGTSKHVAYWRPIIHHIKGE